MCFSYEPFVFLALTISIDPLTTFRVVFTRNSGEAVDVIAKITTDDYTRCIRRISSQIVPTYSEPENSNGYLCGHEFFTDEIIHQSIALAQVKYTSKTKYPSPSFGLLFPTDSGYLIWPITRGKKLYRSGTGNCLCSSSIQDKERQFVDVVVRGFNHNFLRCIRSRQPPKAPASDPYSKLFVPPPKSGYLCGKTFFDEKVLEGDAKIAESQASNRFNSQFPKDYSGPPYYQKCLIWPIAIDGKLYQRGAKGPYRFILSLDYKVMGVAILVGVNLKACDKITIMAKKNHDTSDYNSKYEGSGFNSDGPFFTYPVLRYGVYTQRSAGPNRVVINTNCEVVGALTELNAINIDDIKNGLLK
ncbi:hypothetical protein EPUL_005250, partial [Erysiphe pulchra]